MEKYREFYLCLWTSIFVYGVLSLYAVVGCMYMDRLGACMRLLGAKYAVVGCKSMDTFGCMYAAFHTFTQCTHESLIVNGAAFAYSS